MAEQVKGCDGGMRDGKWKGQKQGVAAVQDFEQYK